MAFRAFELMEFSGLRFSRFQAYRVPVTSITYSLEAMTPWLVRITSNPVRNWGYRQALLETAT